MHILDTMMIMSRNPLKSGHYLKLVGEKTQEEYEALEVAIPLNRVII